MEIASGPFSRRYFFALPAWLCPVRDPFPPCTGDAGRMHRWLSQRGLLPPLGRSRMIRSRNSCPMRPSIPPEKGSLPVSKFIPVRQMASQHPYPARTKDVLLQQDILAVQSAAAVSARKSVLVSLIPAMADDSSSHRVRRDTLFCRVPAAAKVLSVIALSLLFESPSDPPVKTADTKRKDNRRPVVYNKA